MKIYLGSEQAVKSNWKEILGDPKKPANWKDETYAAKKAELELKQMAEAPTHVAAGYCSRVTLLIEKSAAVTDAIKSLPFIESGNMLMVTDTALVAVNTLVKLTDICRGERLSIFGVNTLETLRQLAWSSAENDQMPPSWVWNAGGDYNSVNIVNLYSCSGAKTDTDMTPAQFMTYWAPVKIIDSMKPAFGLKTFTYSQQQALAVLLIATRLGF